ncbi:H-2 class II histocompatibility antigen, E-S beta chain-like isoform X2 [Poecilia formosa]|uniref:H-2 class II histocompatibility antigen, E-S beta chain-like isoform X2 n=1 Tax=Poecilia formosa TaxID=48698 RepID=UPI0007BA901C|nr:PREDICTED: H-2 class II histocompatibility antigen, E-S beta chain-like isoform X2 [Poecilia formosa]
MQNRIFASKTSVSFLSADNMWTQRLIFLELLLVFSSEGAFYGYYLGRCQFNSPDSNDVVLVEQLYFNKILLGQYNSTLGKVVAFIEKAEAYADMLNKMPRFQAHQIWKINRCKTGAQLANENLPAAVEPYVWLRSVKAEYSQHQQKLVCSAYDFYPKKIRVTWLKDGKNITSGVTSTDELPNGHWLYQIHSYLEFTPKPGEKIACMVDHASLKEPKLYDLEPEPDSGKHKMVVGSAGLLLGLLFSVMGFIFFKKKSIERVRVPTSEEIPENNP